MDSPWSFSGAPIERSAGEAEEFREAEQEQ
jgi:hypothetical protein